MCSLPVYEKVPTYEVDAESRLTTHSAANVQTDAKRVVFTYNPIWPRPGSLQHVSGLLGPTEDLTLQNIYAYFPTLSNIPADRISFRLPVLDDATLAATILASASASGNPTMMVGPHPVRAGGARAGGGMPLMAFEQWADISPETWTSFQSDPPRRMAVIVADAPGEGVKRTLRTISFILALILMPIALLVGFLGLMVYLDV